MNGEAYNWKLSSGVSVMFARPVKPAVRCRSRAKVKCAVSVSVGPNVRTHWLSITAFSRKASKSNEVRVPTRPVPPTESERPQERPSSAVEKLASTPGWIGRRTSPEMEKATLFRGESRSAGPPRAQETQCAPPSWLPLIESEPLQKLVSCVEALALSDIPAGRPPVVQWFSCPTDPLTRRYQLPGRVVDRENEFRYIASFTRVTIPRSLSSVPGSAYRVTVSQVNR